MTEIAVFPLDAEEAVQVPLRSDELCFCYFFGDEQVDSVPRLQTLAESQSRPAVLGLYTGESRPQSPWELKPFVYWSGPGGLDSALCRKYAVTSLPVFLVLRGQDTLLRRTSLPQDFSRLVPMRETYASLSRMSFTARDRVKEVLREAKAAGERISAERVSEVLKQLSFELGIEVGEAEPWFRSKRYWADPSDVIDPEDVTEEQFLRRLQSFCGWRSSLGAVSFQPLQWLYGKIAVHGVGEKLGIGKERRQLQAALAGARAEAAELSAALRQRDARIDSLLSELAQKNAEILRLQAPSEPSELSSKSPEASRKQSPEPQKANPLLLQKPPKQEETEEQKFWKYEREDDWEPLRINPHKFEEIASAKGLWLMTAETIGIIDSTDIGMKLLSSKKSSTPRKPLLPSLRGSTKQR